MNIGDKVVAKTNDDFNGKCGVINRITDETAYNLGVMLDDPKIVMIVWFTESELDLIK